MKKAGNEIPGEVKSPCIKKCSLDRNKICPGCYRSIEEIISWRDADDSLKRKILESARRRRPHTQKKNSGR